MKRAPTAKTRRLITHFSFWSVVVLCAFIIREAPPSSGFSFSGPVKFTVCVEAFLFALATVVSQFVGQATASSEAIVRSLKKRSARHTLTRAAIGSLGHLFLMMILLAVAAITYLLIRQKEATVPFLGLALLNYWLALKNDALNGKAYEALFKLAHMEPLPKTSLVSLLGGAALIIVVALKYNDKLSKTEANSIKLPFFSASVDVDRLKRLSGLSAPQIASALRAEGISVIALGEQATSDPRCNERVDNKVESESVVSQYQKTFRFEKRESGLTPTAIFLPPYFHSSVPNRPLLNGRVIVTTEKTCALPLLREYARALLYEAKGRKNPQVISVQGKYENLQDAEMRNMNRTIADLTKAGTSSPDFGKRYLQLHLFGLVLIHETLAEDMAIDRLLLDLNPNYPGLKTQLTDERLSFSKELEGFRRRIDVVKNRKDVSATPEYAEIQNALTLMENWLNSFR